MSVRFVLDTDHISLLQRGDRWVSDSVAAIPSEALAVTSVSMEEQLQGRLAVLRRAREPAEIVRAYQRLDETVGFFCAVQVLTFDTVAAERCESFRRAGIRIGTLDLRIAAIVIAHGATLVTRNRSDFQHCPGVLLVDWSVPSA